MRNVAPLRPEDPERIGGYRLTGRLGEGGQGVVYLSAHENGELIAIKVLHARLVRRADVYGRLRDEISLVRRVAEFCTARVLDFGADGDRSYIVTEYVDGPSLQALVETDGPLSGGALARLMVGTASALAATHRAGVLHRDFTPHNVLVGPDGPRVIDFGIARALDTAATVTSGLVGTPAYTAPELLSGDHEPGPETDIFSWGITMTFAATGRLAFGSDSIPAVFSRILNEDPDIAGVPSPYREVIARCLDKDRRRRPEARDILLGLLGYEHVEAASSAIELPEGIRSPDRVTVDRQGRLTADRQDDLNVNRPDRVTVARPDRSTPSDRGPSEPPRRRRSAERSPDRRPPGRRLLPHRSPDARTIDQAAEPTVEPASVTTRPRWWQRRLTWLVAAGLAIVVAGAALAFALVPDDRSRHAKGPAITVPPPPVTVGSANFPESALLAEIYAQALEASGFRVTRKFDLGSRETYFGQVMSGDIDVIPEYTGALAASLDGSGQAGTAEQVEKVLREKLPGQLQLLSPSTAEDKDSVTVTRKTAGRYHLKEISDLKDVANEIVMGGTQEFQVRHQGQVGLRETYGLNFKDYQPFATNDRETMIQQLRDDVIQAADLFTTEPAIKKYEFVVLADTKHLFGTQKVTPLIYRSAVSDRGRAALNAVSTKLTTEGLLAMNSRVAVDKVDGRIVARDWLRQHGLAG